LQKHSHAGFSFSPVWNYCHSELKNIPSNPYLPKELIAWLGEHELADGAAMGSVYELLLSVNCVATSSVVAHRRALLEVDLFDESFNNGEDYDLWLRLARRFPAVVFSRPTSRYRVHETGLSGSWHARARLFYRYNIRVLERHRAQFPSSLTRDAIAEHYSGFAYYLLCHGELKDARAMAERSLQIQPNFAALRTYFEARFPDGYAWLSRRLRRVRS